jgi:FAD/FMN-containing dehydrogenase
MSMDESDPRLDGNAVAGMLAEGLLRSHSAHSGSAGGYINFMSGDDDRRAADNYGANYERLSAVKAVYDPDNLFHVNKNIAPAKPR